MGARRRAAREAGAKPRPSRTTDHERDRLSLLHELHVYQDELRAQNEELQLAQTALEKSRDRFAELYDFAPNAYLSLDPNGIVIQINLTGAQMLGRPRQRIEGLPFIGFVAAESRSHFLEFLRMCRIPTAAAAADGSATQVNIEVLLQTPEGPRDVQIICRPGSSNTDTRELLAAIVDISERRRVEAERTRIAKDHAALATRLLSAQDEERQRIARDLHDHVGQQVTAVRLMLQLAEMEAVSDGVRKRLEQAQAVIEQIDRQLDFIAAELRPASLDLGLASAVEQFVRDWSSTFGVTVDCRCRGLDDMHLGTDVETHIYRVVQEALNNVYKHAGARHVSVLLEKKDDELLAAVRDDGQGFDLASHSTSRHQPHGLGLLGMRERAQLVGGALTIESEPNHGTVVRLRVPIADRTESR